MTAFRNTVLIDEETSPWNMPDIQLTTKLLSESLRVRETRHLISKRNASWHRRENIHSLASFVKDYGMNIILIVRDPRDVLSSSHKLSPADFYVSFDFWQRSFEAGLELQRLIGDENKFLSLRYEDVIQSPEEVETLLNRKLGFEKYDGVVSIANLKDNMTLRGLTDSRMVDYMHRLRNLDPASVGAWRRDTAKTAHISQLLQSKDRRDSLSHFFRTYGYDSETLE